ncbi:3-phosphoshikimate 1-carboxyvinyltransferase [Chryseomicrobium palamuruense]|uniref:3-phosphoshikimate 1-carboxyvinyltransferase n=1 Tax=Chryseomicrobium palamuruense TaxID=682973 RepID=A0ABV8UVV0_9BACL
MNLPPFQGFIRGTVQVPGDKSISHRSILFGAMAKGKTTVEGFLLSEDCHRSIECVRKVGVQVDVDQTNVTIQSDGIESWQEPTEILYTGNSGTTTRLLAGILASSRIASVMIGDESIQKRPMKRVTDPLKQMGAEIIGRENSKFTPLAIQGKELSGIDYTMPVASAQVKSAILLAGLRAKGTTVVREQETSRDHTERMLTHFGVKIEEQDRVITLEGGQTLHPAHIVIPGDISSAAFWLVAAAIVPNSSLTLENVGLNSTRDGIIEVLTDMGATLDISKGQSASHEEIGTVTIQSSQLTGLEISGSLIPRLIDEIPIIALLATQAQGKTVIRDAEELKVKETNRIDAVVTELKKLGAKIESTKDGMIIEGPTPLTGGKITTYGDHRIGMMGAIASLISTDAILLDDADCIAVSYPTFFEDYKLVTTGS